MPTVCTTQQKKLLMPPFPEDRFIEAVKQVVAANHEYVPPYGTGATLYLRPMLIGVGPNIGVAPAKEYIFDVFAMPVGPYFKGGMVPTKFVVADQHDRAAHYGTGQAKVGGNYAASLQAGKFTMNMVMAMRFTLTRSNINILKKWVRLTFSVSLRTVKPLKHRNPLRFCQVLPNTQSWRWHMIASA